MPLITALAIFLIVYSLMVIFSNIDARDGFYDVSLQSQLLILGLNPYFPWTCGSIAQVVAIIIPEAGYRMVVIVYGTLI